MIRHEGDPGRCAVLLPGIRYFSQAPLLWFAREVAQAQGWSVVEVDERAPADEEPCARKILTALAARAYRRPATETDIQALLPWLDWAHGVVSAS